MKPKSFLGVEDSESTAWILYGILACVLLFIFLVVAGLRSQKKHLKKESEEADRIKQMSFKKAKLLMSEPSTGKVMHADNKEGNFKVMKHELEDHIDF